MKLILLILALAPALLRAQVTDADALAFLQKHAPEIHRQVAPLEKSDPQDFRSALDDAKQAAAKHAKFVAAGDSAAAAAGLKMYSLDFAAISIANDIVQSKDKAEDRAASGAHRQKRRGRERNRCACRGKPRVSAEKECREIDAG
jgi:hypothetical protein